MGRLRDSAVHNTARPEPKPENSNGVGPYSGARVPSAAHPERRSRTSNEEGPPSGFCRTQHGPAGTEARELKRGRAAFGMLPYATQPGRNRSPRTQTGSGHIRSRGTFCGPAGPKVSGFKQGRATFGILPYTTQPSRNQSTRTQTAMGRLQNTAVRNTAQLEPKSESSNGVGPHLGARARGSCYATQAPVSTSRVENSPMVEMTSSAVRA